MEPVRRLDGYNPVAASPTLGATGLTDVVSGKNTVSIVPREASGNTKTNNYQVAVSSGANRTFSYDLDGNLMNDGIKTYEWDAANRLLAINYTGTSNRTEFTYDGLGRRTKIVEKTGTTINSAKTFVWDGLALAEERNNSNKVTRKHYPQGVQFVSYNPTTTTPYFYMRDHLGSIREMTDGTGTIKARYDYDPWGSRTKLGGGLDADFGFTRHYYHAPSNLHLAPYRGYDSTIGRWLRRDPIEEERGINLYGYVRINPTNLVDPDGRNPVVIGGAIIVVAAAIIAYNAYKIIHATEEFAKPYKEQKDECERILTDPQNAERHVQNAQAATAEAQKKAEALAAEAASQALSNPLGGAPGLPP
jgi:RHS repeat-associated protein